MKKNLLFLAFTFSQMIFAQMPTPIYQHGFSGSLASPNFTVSEQSGIWLTSDRNNVSSEAGYLSANHGRVSVDISANKANLMQQGTISLWFKYEGQGPSAFGTNKPLVFWSNGRDSFSEGVVLTLTEFGSIKVLSYKDNLTGGVTSGGFGDSSDSWHHYTLTWKFLQNGNWGYIKGYVDGVEIASRVIDYPMPSTATDVIYFTGFSNSFSSSLYGSIDDIKVFTEALTATQIMGLYDGTLNNNDFNKSEITVYPNPTQGIVNLSEEADVMVYDILGRLVFEQKKISSFDLSNQAVGTYLAKIKSEKGTETIKIVRK